jgi:hypothetical protein
LIGGEDRITVQVKYGDVEETFSGRVDDVWVSVNRFFGEFIPTFEVSKKLVLTVDLQELVKACEGIVAFAEESPHLLVSRSKLTDNETLVLLLLAGYVGCRLGLVGSDVVSKEELQVRLGKSSKIVSTRLGELVKREIAVKTKDGKYRISAFGVVQMEKDFLPRIRAKIGG